MINPLTCVRLCKACYADSGQFDRVIDTGTVWLGVKDLGAEGYIIAGRGSRMLDDWINDFDALMTQTPMGRLERGFSKGGMEAASQLRAHIDVERPITYTGHSYGAPHVYIMAAEIDCPALVYGFGAPKPGDVAFKSYLEDRHIIVMEYINSGDVVPDAPLSLPLEPYVHPATPVFFNEPPVNSFDIFARHNIDLYEKGMLKLFPTGQ
jgi:Lipase (class 3)